MYGSRTQFGSGKQIMVSFAPSRGGFMHRADATSGSSSKAGGACCGQTCRFSPGGHERGCPGWPARCRLVLAWPKEAYRVVSVRRVRFR